MKLKTKRSVALEAARRIAEGENVFCCCALGASCGRDYHNLFDVPEVIEFTELFHPKATEAERDVYGTFWMNSCEDSPETTHHSRVIALLLFAEMLRR